MCICCACFVSEVNMLGYIILIKLIKSYYLKKNCNVTSLFRNVNIVVPIQLIDLCSMNLQNSYIIHRSELKKKDLHGQLNKKGKLQFRLKCHQKISNSV